jgi:GDP-4-dehydro-6-deoxy-D-mannose reductase
MRSSDVPEVICDATRLRQRTGWQATISFEESLRDILAYWRAETKRQSQAAAA